MCATVEPSDSPWIATVDRAPSWDGVIAAHIIVARLLLIGSIRRERETRRATPYPESIRAERAAGKRCVPRCDPHALAVVAPGSTNSTAKAESARVSIGIGGVANQSPAQARDRPLKPSVYHGPGDAVEHVPGRTTTWKTSSRAFGVMVSVE
jgi:hypothetical protein